MKCPSCGNPNLLVEGLGDGKKKLVCQKCPYQTIMDEQGRQMLTDTKQIPDPGKRLLTEAM